MKKSNLVIITGASRGIGFAIATKLLRSGFSVYVIANQKANLERAVLKK